MPTYETVDALATTRHVMHTVPGSCRKTHALCPCMPRLFIALDPSQAQRDALARLKTDTFAARWTPPAQYHLTLRFLGDTTPETTATVCDALADITASPCPIEGTGLGTFPSLRNPRVLFARVEPNPALIALQDQVEALCQRLGFPAERHSFTPHLTVARLQKADPATVYRFVQDHADWTYPSHRAKKVTLYKSTLHPAGAQHTAVTHIPLRE